MSERARIWQRVSTGGQDEASQLPDLVAWCDSHGYEYDLSERYVIHGKSAYKGKHGTALDQAFADMASGKYAVLVVWAADRIERRGALAALLLAQRAREAGGRIEYVKDAHLNAAHVMSDTMLALSGDIARQESKRKSDRTLADHAARRDRGSVIGRPAWGYRITCTTCGEVTDTCAKQRHTKILTPTETGRKYVPLIFQAVIDGKSLRDIAAWLDGEGVPTPTDGARWHEAFIGNRLIKNTTYYGQRPNAGTLETEALVTATTWREANAALASRVRPGRGTVVHAKPLIAPYCAACWDEPREGCPDGHSPMYRVFAGKGSSRRAYFRCTGHGPQRKGCGARMIPVDEAEGAVIDAMRHDQRPHIDKVFVPGDDAADRIMKLREKGAAAMRAGDYDAATDAMREASELENAPKVIAHWVDRETGLTNAQHFATLDQDGQRDYLRKMLVLIMAGPDHLLAAVEERGESMTL